MSGWHRRPPSACSFDFLRTLRLKLRVHFLCVGCLCECASVYTKFLNLFAKLLKKLSFFNTKKSYLFYLYWRCFDTFCIKWNTAWGNTLMSLCQLFLFCASGTTSSNWNHMSLKTLFSLCINLKSKLLYLNKYGTVLHNGNTLSFSDFCKKGVKKTWKETWTFKSTGSWISYQMRVGNCDESAFSWKCL